MHRGAVSSLNSGKGACLGSIHGPPERQSLAFNSRAERAAALFAVAMATRCGGARRGPDGAAASSASGPRPCQEFGGARAPLEATPEGYARYTAGFTHLPSQSQEAGRAPCIFLFFSLRPSWAAASDPSPHLMLRERRCAVWVALADWQLREGPSCALCILLRCTKNAAYCRAHSREPIYFGRIYQSGDLIYTLIIIKFMLFLGMRFLDDWLFFLCSDLSFFNISLQIIKNWVHRHPF